MSPHSIVLDTLDGVGKTTAAHVLADERLAVAMKAPGEALSAGGPLPRPPCVGPLCPPSPVSALFRRPDPGAHMRHHPSYLRVVITARCSLACSYCHKEGDPATANAGGLGTDALVSLLHAALDNGVRKLKFLGGEPLLRSDLPVVIAAMRARDPALDISLITGGAAPVARLDACLCAGLSRANLSIHGWGVDDFGARSHRGARHHAMRQAMLHRLLEIGRTLKLNFVWRGIKDDADLAALLDWAAVRPVVVSVLDDLGDPTLGPTVVQGALLRLRGQPVSRMAEPDPHSLPTLRMAWSDGLLVEVKDQHLGDVAPWRACVGCPAREKCREGIHALRLSHDGHLRPCMDRPDVALDLRAVLAHRGSEAASVAWTRAVAAWQADVHPASVEVPC